MTNTLLSPKSSLGACRGGLMPPLPLSFSNLGPTWQGASCASKDNFVTDRKAPVGCCRDTLPDLMIFLLPTWISDLHSKKTLIELCEANVHDWGKSMIKIQLTPGWGLPWLEVDVYEFKPSNPELLRQFQHLKDAKTGQNMRVGKASPPLGLQNIDYIEDETKYDTHVKQIAAHFMPIFVGRYYAGEKEEITDGSLLPHHHHLYCCTHFDHT
ncbi:hypothetical protein EJ05DRAFT_490835 [Pseudovirgaria hyperparasitica]|uniref:Uncharacterized protein n=1 Tax=Pseudovirgaria hyperparasitica TaxID=470096 RepID=A0A6A6VQV5_9PEZI|nr:uncharacterized protein EJ05DRAFT_490835 [Pseudovirgaria hyperparasitica]KAF2752515.1 hypothetical protein EJ05DRAFT_490835 [Pseudovirgaria hyperparasitica]